MKMMYNIDFVWLYLVANSNEPFSIEGMIGGKYFIYSII
jgi:hypothetical protein